MQRRSRLVLPWVIVGSSKTDLQCKCRLCTPVKSGNIFNGKISTSHRCNDCTTKLHSALYLPPRSAPTRALLPGQHPFTTLVVSHHAWSAPRKGAPSRAPTYPAIRLILLRAWSAPQRALLPGQQLFRTAEGIESSPFPPIVSSGCCSRRRRPLKGPP